MSGIIGGIEGGATHSHVILVDQNGQILAALEGPGTNHHLIGIEECQRLINEMVDEAKAKANLPLEEPLLALGLSLSGCEREESNQEIIKGLEENYPNLSKQYAIGSDTDGSVAATSDKGGVVCISGTGSNTLLINPDGSRAQCGGWGYLLGDEGSGYGVSRRAIKICFDALDNFRPPPYPIEKVWQKVQDYFSIESQADLFQHLSMNFDKNMIGKFCIELVGLAHEGIELAQFIFYELGAILARQIAAVFPKVAPELMNQPGGGLLVVCIGSVWLSWDLMKPGFEYWMDQNHGDKEFVLGNLVCEHALGTTYFACDKLGIDLRRTYDKNIAVFYHYTMKNRAKCICPHNKQIQESEW